MTRLIPVDKTQLFLKLSDFNKNRLVTFFSLCYKESDFMCEKCKRVWMTVIHLLPLPTEGCYQPTVANCQQSVGTFCRQAPKPIITV